MTNFHLALACLSLFACTTEPPSSVALVADQDTDPPQSCPIGGVDPEANPQCEGLDSTADGETLRNCSDSSGALYDLALIDGLSSECVFGVVAHHKPGSCYGACGAGCRGCCEDFTMYCPPVEMIVAGGWNNAAGGPALCTTPPVLASLTDVSTTTTTTSRKMICGVSQMGFVNNGGPGRGRLQSNQSIGSCPKADWRAAVPQWQGGGGAVAWIATGKQYKACSQHQACFGHDECNRHDSWHSLLGPSSQLQCQAWGIRQVGAQAAAGTPSVPFASAWWTADGGMPLVGNTATSGGSPAPSTACYYDITGGAAGFTVTFDSVADAPAYTDHPTQVQVACPIHGKKH